MATIATNMLPPHLASVGNVAAPRGIQLGDLVIVHENNYTQKAVYVSANGRFENKFGAFLHKDWLGKPFGTKVYAKNGGRGWVYLLAPSADMWSLVLRHRTQILYIADNSVVCFNLELMPGCTVLESGTGSASLTHSLARAVAPHGKVHTFEFHKLRADEASKELTANGLGDVATVTQRDIMELGFPQELEQKGSADGVFLDLPGPWKVVPSAAKCLRPDGRFCSFSPCIEQVQRTCEALEANGFTDIKTIEVLLRMYDVKSEKLLLCCGATSLDDTTNHGASAAAAEGHGAAEGAGDKEQAGTSGQEGQGAGEGGEGGEGGEVAADGAAASEAAAGKSSAVGQKRGREGEAAGGPGKQQQGKTSQTASGAVQVVTCKPAMEARGHTGFLTFARKFVFPA